jgi:hypothetical protein
MRKVVSVLAFRELGWLRTNSQTGAKFPQELNAESSRQIRKPDPLSSAVIINLGGIASKTRPFTRRMGLFYKQKVQKVEEE